MQIIREIKQGGFGIVQEITLDNRVFARKIFHPNAVIATDPDIVQKAKKRFVREISVQKAIKHPNIMPVVQVNAEDDPPWFLMPLADESYSEQIQRDRLTQSVTLQPLLDILAGLEELHRLGYVHRDLKPDNILLLDNRWVLSDLGLVMPTIRATTILTSTDSAWGTELYAAPELIQNFRNAPPQSDIYSFGCILHDLVGEPMRIPYSQLTHEGPLGPVIERCTVLNPERRFSDIASLRSALVLVLSEPFVITGTDQAQEWVRMLETEFTSLK